MSDEPSRDEFDERLRRLNARRDAERAEATRTGAAKSDWGMAVKLSSEFIAAIVVGGALGFGFDAFFDTLPWGLIAFFMLGFAAAIVNVLRAVGQLPESKLNMRAVDEAAPREDDRTG